MADNFDIARRIDPAAYNLPQTASNAEAISRAFALAKQQGCNLVGAESTISYVPPGYSVVFRLVRFDPEAPKTWYKTDDGFALSFVALSQLADLAGVTWDYSRPLPVPRGERYLWRNEACATRRLLDGTRRQVMDSAELDLRSDRPEDSGCKSPAMLLKKRQKGAAHCASSAKARVIRQLLGIRTYSPQEQGRPFVVVTLAWIPPVGNAEVDKMIAATELGVVSQVYGTRPRALPAPTEVFDEFEDEETEPETVPVEREQPAQSRGADRREPPPVEDAPWDPPAETKPAEPGHHPSWAADQRPFFAELGKLATAWGVDEVKDYKVVCEFCASIKRPRPSAMSQQQRVGLIGWLTSQPGRNAFESWLHTGEAAPAK